MIKKEVLENILEEVLKEMPEVFLVDFKVSSTNSISVFIDSLEGVNVQTCVGISREIEQKLDREKEDFELNVSTPGIDIPLKYPFQLKKNIGRTAKVWLLDKKKIEGALVEAENEDFVIEYVKITKEGKKKKKELVKESFNLNEIEKVKIVVSFK